MADGTRLDFRILAQPYTPTKKEFIDVFFPTVTTAQLADATHRINVKDKFLGRQVYESTLKLAYVADGPDPTDDWTLNDGLGATQVTPS